MDFRRMFLIYLEAPNSIVTRNPEIDRILLNLTIFLSFPLFGVPWAAVLLRIWVECGCSIRGPWWPIIHACGPEERIPAMTCVSGPFAKPLSSFYGLTDWPDEPIVIVEASQQ